MVHHGIDKDSRQLIERVHTFPPPPLASLVRPPWPSHYKSKLDTPPPFQLQSSPDSSSYTAFLAYQTPSSYTSVAGSIVFCLPGLKNIHQLAQFAAVSPTSIRQHNGRELFSSCPSCHSGTFCVAASSPPHDGHCIRCGPRTRLLCRRSQQPHHR